MINHPFYNEPGFWGFLSTVILTTRWLIRVVYLYVERSQKLDLSIENIKNSNAIKLLTQLKSSVDVIMPIIARHQDAVDTLDKSITSIKETQNNFSLMVARLDQQFAEFNRVVPNVMTAINAVTDDIFKMKTEILELKKGSGNLYITTKKEKV